MLGFGAKLRRADRDLVVFLFGLGSIVFGIVFCLVWASGETTNRATVIGMLTFAPDSLFRSSFWIAIGYGLILLGVIRAIRRTVVSNNKG